MSKKKSKSWPELGFITKNEGKDRQGNEYTILGIKFAENVQILVDGEEIKLNKYRSVNLISPSSEIETLYANGYIEEDKIEERREWVKNNPWLKYKIVAPPPKPGE